MNIGKCIIGRGKIRLSQTRRVRVGIQGHQHSQTKNVATDKKAAMRLRDRRTRDNSIANTKITKSRQECYFAVLHMSNRNTTVEFSSRGWDLGSASNVEERVYIRGQSKL